MKGVSWKRGVKKKTLTGVLLISLLANGCGKPEVPAEKPMDMGQYSDDRDAEQVSTSGETEEQEPETEQESGRGTEIESNQGEKTMDIMNLQAFGMDEVVQLDDYCTNSLELELAYLTSFDADKLLAGFRETAGLSMKGAARYGGWENTLIGGHTMGHYLTAMAQAYVNAGVSEEDKKTIYAMLTEIVDGLLECQQNSKGKEGFLFGATVLDASNVELQFDNVEQGQSNIITQAWVPWYTMHKILTGLLEVYERTGYENALTVAKGLGDWTYNRAAGWDSATRARVLGIEYGGMNDVLYELYKVTGDEKYAVAAHLFDEDALFKRVLAGGKNVLDNKHANTTIPKFMGALNRYVAVHGKTINGEVVDASGYLEYAKAFWDMVVEHHTYITGANSEWEHFGKDDILDKERTNCNNETCNVYNMLKLSRTLFEITGERKYADYYENAFYNSILSSQNPVTGMTMYFQPMATGYFKTYGTQFTKFWCCTGTGMENFTKLNDSIYFHNEDDVVVNLYLSSELIWAKKNLKLTQRANFPAEDKAVFTVHSLDGADRVDVNLCFRIPEWTVGEALITVNGEKHEAEMSGGYAKIKGSFANGDEITITLPMQVTAYNLPDDESSIGFKYGPVVLSADLGTENKETTTTGMFVTIPAEKLVEREVFVLPQGVSREEFIQNINDYMLCCDEDKTAFRLSGIDGADLVFSPHYLRYQERYGIYWYFKTVQEYAEEEAKKIRAKKEIIDTVQPGYGQYENDDLHAMKEKASVGVTNDGTYRYACADGYFSYFMAVKPDGNNYISLTLRAEDNGKPLCIMSGDRELFSDVLDYIGLEKTYELRVAIPQEVLATAQKVSANGENYEVIPVTFTGINGEESARVCDFIYMLDVIPLYECDERVAYFVDCGDYDPNTVSDGDSFGVYNSVTEQLYGYDSITGKKWGLIDDAHDQYGGAKSGRGGLYTAHTWCFEFNEGDGKNKTASNRYTKNQYEDGIKERYLDYAFELPNGSYTVEIGFSNPWSCSDLHNVYANLGMSDEVLLAESFHVTDKPLTAKVDVHEGKLTLNFRNATASGLAINVTYIKIYFAE